MARNTRPIQFRDYLPEVFQADDVGGSFLSRFLQAFEALFEKLEAAIEGTPGGILPLTVVQDGSGTSIIVAPFNSGPVGFPIGTPVTVSNKACRTTLLQAIPARGTGLTQIEVQDALFASVGDVLNVHPGGIPDLFNPDTTPPPQFTPHPQQDFDYLNYLASWIALPLRPDKPLDFNRAFFKTAIALYPQRGTLPGLDGLLRAWLKGDLLETQVMLTDLTPAYTDVDTVFQLGMTATLGVDTVLGQGPPFFFLVDLVTDPKVRALRNPIGLDVLQREARLLLDNEKPAHTYYQLRVRAQTMQLAPAGRAPEEGFPLPYAQIGVTTLLSEAPRVFNSDC
jgi:hypothetical protein